MNTGALALLIPILAIVGGYVVAIMKIRNKQGMSTCEQVAENQAFQTELAILRQRIEVLEQLATDDGFQLKREFKKV
ncbi:hypothetical protein [Shewanella oncorhynchi]|uniref:hypothetical protein n=1 Tax=Shewanella oncorhynchi TaxID=2726434 RepID=UPI002E7C52A0|nr:hypothetical protein [Shewanella oncorhynchi]WVI94050.1 hypothetical protein VR487_03455 [Shewanella oncorhynchi]